MPMPNAQALQALPYEQMVEVIRRWTRKNIADTQCWNFWARDDQAEPPEDWRIWLVLAVSQAQKEITHNEALVMIDALLHMAVEAALSAAPAVTDDDIGKSWAIHGTPTAAWASKAGQIAHWVGGSWRFVVPHEGMRVWNKSTRRHSWFIAGQWTTAPSIPNPTGGATVDSEARAALVAILQYFRSIGILAT